MIEEVEVTEMFWNSEYEMYVLISDCPICGQKDAIPGEIQEGSLDGINRVIRIFTCECCNTLHSITIPDNLIMWMTIKTAKKYGVIK